MDISSVTSTSTSTSTSTAARATAINRGPLPPHHPSLHQPQKQVKRSKRKKVRTHEVKGGQNNNNIKSRPAVLAQMCVAIGNHTDRCTEAGEPFTLTPDALRRILHDQSGSKAHHTDVPRDTREQDDPLRHILPHCTICDAGTDTSVFRPDVNHFALRNWPELYLRPILAELRQLRKVWDLGEEAAILANQDSNHDPLSDLLNPTEDAQTRYAPARPLW